MSYKNSVKKCQDELIWFIKNNENVTFDKLLDNPIYPNNEELKEDFTYEYGFDEEEFISFLIGASDVLDIVYSGKLEDLIITLI